VRTVSVAEDPALEILMRAGTLGTPERLVGAIIQNWRDVGEQFARVVDGGDWVIVPEGPLAAAPWEFVAGPAPRRLVIANPEARSMLDQLEIDPVMLRAELLTPDAPSAPLGWPKVLLVDSGADAAEDDLSRKLKSAGCDVGRIQARRLLETPPLSGTAVVVVGDRISQVKQQPYLMSSDLSASEFASRLTVDPSSPAMVVILAPPPPSSVTEAVETLMIRNLFAYQLAQTGRVAAVLATGLGDHEQQRSIYRILAEAIAARKKLGDVLGEIRGLSPGDAPLDRALALRGTALFTLHPDQAIAP